jgi:transcriptional regulator with XRE-family HTH domain
VGVKPSRIAVDLVTYRKQAGLTQSEVARRMGTTQSVVARAETNWETLPTLDFLERFARAIGRPITITLGEDVEPGDAEVEGRSQAVLRGFEFDPWERPLADIEKKGLVREGLTREHFQGRRASKRRRSRN